MAHKKKSKLETMKELSAQIGEDSMESLIKKEVILVRDSNGEIPYQIICNPSGKCIFDSRNRGALSYECFEEIKNSDFVTKREFQNFYGLKQGHLEAYKKYIRSLNKK